jgi:hypothetical protein
MHGPPGTTQRSWPQEKFAASRRGCDVEPVCATVGPPCFDEASRRDLCHQQVRPGFLAVLAGSLVVQLALDQDGRFVHLGSHVGGMELLAAGWCAE